MEIGVLVFSLCLLLAGIILIFRYLAEPADTEEQKLERPLKDYRAAHQRELREGHRMRRQRTLVWWRVENLYSEFMQRTELKDFKDEKADSSAALLAGTARQENDPCEALTTSEVSEAFETFLRQTK